MLAWAAGERSAGHTIGFTCGAFDILHAGHVEYLTAAHEYCDRLIVAVNSDQSVRAYKSPLRPINQQEHRLRVVAALEAVNAVTLMPETRPAALIQALKPDVYIKGGDYRPEELDSGPLVEAYGGRLICVPIKFNTSTSAILDRAAAISVHAKPAERPRSERRLALLDRDGTLIRDIPFLHDPAKVELMPGVLDGLKRLQDAGFTLVIVTNQQGIGLGYYTENEFIEVNRALFRRLAPAGIRIARVYYCPHSYADECTCRKPGSLLLEEALAYFETTADHSCFIGDSTADCVAAAAVGCTSVLVSTQASSPSCTHQAAFFGDAVDWIIRCQCWLEGGTVPFRRR